MISDKLLELEQKINSIISANETYLSIAPKKLQSILESQYQMAAIEFLYDTKTTCDILKIGKDYQPWGIDSQIVDKYLNQPWSINSQIVVDKYHVTLKNFKGGYSFPFYASIKDTEEGKSLELDFYSILACLDVHVDESFDNFCLEFGYEFKSEREYLRIKKTHQDCLDMAKALRKMFSERELEMLSNIN